ncbi:cytochrome c oxidase subunit 3 [Hyalangium rubrum]|uniref:Cytochrome C oxidase subunit III n=1 Tax=Hyalangium rubrum TaxID=3103134 RepID=A0ABU5HD07_9BACT|nr:cytochrome C oxidase subunit III [Hyalangium sp. s54d21]MDY7231349.1 cytochrome C oxidase subunit III [Hyalangium sp. s54d21]
MKPTASQADAETQWFGVVVGLGAWTMLFAALAFTVGYLRMREPWPSEGTLSLPRLLPALNLLLLVGGSALMHAALQRLRRAPDTRGAALLRYVGGALGLGAAFLGLQAGLARTLWEAGLRLPSGGAQASAFYGLMGIHATHALVGLVGLTGVAVALHRGKSNTQPLRLWGLYWHFVTCTGWLFYGAVYLP